MASDTVIVWEPTGWYGTGLAHCDPEADDPKFYQAGLVIVTPVSSINLWKRVQKGEKSVEEAEQDFISYERL